MQQVKQEARFEASLSTLMLRHVYVPLYVFVAQCSDDKR
jgi:hypothetical protein